MKSSSARVSYVLFSLLLVLLLSAPSSSADLIEKACRLALDSDACVETIKSFPESASATVPELAIIVLQLASQKAVNVTTHINTLLRNASSLDPIVYQRIDECSVHFQDAVDMVDNSKAALSVQAYDDVTRFLTIAEGDAAACQDGIRSVGSQDLVSELATFNQSFKRLCNIAIVITKAAKLVN
uniref:Pectinesterase inhibitor domain-containing protein n=1 Tax=Kalanchoe fedtschenkoi TaxID=63787 RepID=A0A7N0TLR4_KALFE